MGEGVGGGVLGGLGGVLGGNWCMSLEVLDLSKNNITQKMLEKKGGGGEGRGGKGEAMSFFEGLKKNIHLKKLNLGDNPLGGGGVEGLGESLKGNGGMMWVGLRNTEAESGAYRAFAECLVVNSRIQGLLFY